MPTPIYNEKRSERCSRYLIVLLIAVVILTIPTAFSWLTTESGQIKHLILHLAVVTMLLIIIVQAAWTGRLRFPRHSLHWAVGTWVMINALSALMSPYPYKSINELWRIGMLACLYTATVYAVRSLLTLRVLAYLCTATALIVMAYGFAQIAGYDIVEAGSDPRDRLFSSIGNPNMLAGYLILMSWVTAGLAIDSKNWATRIALLAAIGCMLSGLILTYTKGAWIAFALSVIGCLVWFAMGCRFPFATNVSHRRRMKLFAIFAAIATLFFLIAHKPILGRLYTLKDSVAVRMVYWTGAKGLIEEHPIFGSGAGTFQVAYPEKRPPNFHAAGATHNTLHSHSEPVEILTDLGVVGLVAWLFILFTFYRGIWRMLSQQPKHPAQGLVFGIAAGVTALLLHNLVDVNLRWYVTPTFFWLFLGLSVAASHMSEQPPNEDPNILTFAPGAARWTMAIFFIAVLCRTSRTHIIDNWRSEVCYRTGHILLEKKKWSAATALHARALELNPSNLRSCYEQAFCLYNQKKFAEAIAAYLQVEKLAPNYCQLHCNLGMMYGVVGQWEEALNRFVRAEKSGAIPENFSAADRTGQMCAQIENPQERMAILQKAVALMPERANAHAYLSFCHYELKQVPEAIAEAQKALTLDPKCIRALTGMATIYYEQKDYPHAIESCLRALEIDPHLLDIRVNLGNVYLRNGQRDKAIEEWERVLKEDPDHHNAQDALRKNGKLAGRNAAK